MNYVNPNFEKRKRCVDGGNFIMVIVGCIIIICIGLGVKLKFEERSTPAVLGDRAQLLSIEEIEIRYNIQVLMPTPRELQEWCVRRGAPNVPIDNELGNLTEAGMDWVRCQQEASKHFPAFEKGYTDGQEAK